MDIFYVGGDWSIVVDNVWFIDGMVILYDLVK